MASTLSDLLRSLHNAPVPNGPDIWLFPDIDGCYAVRRSPKHYDGTSKNSVHIFSKCGWKMGEYAENGWTDITRQVINTKVRSVVEGSDIRTDLDLEQAVRYCYLAGQNEKEFKYKRDAFVRSKDGRLFGVMVEMGYAVFNNKFQMLGLFEMTNWAKYFPSGLSDVRYITKRDGEVIKANDTGTIKDMLPAMFEYINKKELLYQPGGPGVKGFEIAGALRAKYHINFRRMQGE